MIDKQFDYDVSNVEHKFNVGDTVYNVTNIDEVIGGGAPHITKGKITRLLLHWGELEYDVQWPFFKSSVSESWLFPTEEAALAGWLRHARKRCQDKISEYENAITVQSKELKKINELLGESEDGGGEAKSTNGFSDGYIVIYVKLDGNNVHDKMDEVESVLSACGFNVIAVNYCGDYGEAYDKCDGFECHVSADTDSFPKEEDVLKTLKKWRASAEIIDWDVVSMECINVDDYE